MIMKRSNSKLLLGIICIAIAALLSFVALPQLYADKAETTSAVKLSRDVPAGTLITENLLSSVEVGAYGLPDTVVRSAEAAVGMVASEVLYAGEYLTSSRLVTEEAYQAQLAAQTKGLESGYCLVTIEFPSVSSGIAGVLRAGNIVDVHECTENKESGVTVQKALPSLYVYDVLNADLQSLTKLDAKLAEAVMEEDTNYDFAPAYVIFRCTVEQAHTLIRLERTEALHLTLQSVGGEG